MKKTINKDIKKYCSEIKKHLPCSSNVKLAFISELKNRIHEYIEEHPDEEITISDIKNRFGTPESIASSFASAEDMQYLHKKAKKYIFYKVLSSILLLALIMAIIILTKVLQCDHIINITNNF
ncbi:MAG: hypothetical protein IJ489_04100 [Clostridia bacterium]|nr:hypothetical protein [Clostridia bacterium]